MGTTGVDSNACQPALPASFYPTFSFITLACPLPPLPPHPIARIPKT